MHGHAFVAPVGRMLKTPGDEAHFIAGCVQPRTFTNFIKFTGSMSPTTLFSIPSSIATNCVKVLPLEPKRKL